MDARTAWNLTEDVESNRDGVKNPTPYTIINHDEGGADQPRLFCVFMCFTMGDTTFDVRDLFCVFLLTEGHKRAPIQHGGNQQP